MAGQAVYAVTHQFFLSERAVYMLVWRARQGLDQQSEEKVQKALRSVREMIETWLDSLSNRVPGVPVTLVVTHIDRVSPAALDRQCAFVQQVAKGRERNLNVLNDAVSFRVNNRTGTGVADLRQALVDGTTKIQSYKEALPGQWIELKKMLLDRQQVRHVREERCCLTDRPAVMGKTCACRKMLLDR